MKQASFLPKLPRDHGGDLRAKKRKTARPFSHKQAIHVVFRSSNARGKWSMLTRNNERLIQKLLNECKARYHIRVYRSVNVGNHLHLLVKTETRQYAIAKTEFQAFLRRFAGAVAFQITGARKTKPRKFWNKLVYSRLVTWGREHEVLHDYLTKNFFESKGLWWGPNDSWFRPVRESLIAAGLGPPG